MKKAKPLYNANKLRADFLTFHVIEHDLTVKQVAKKISIGKSVLTKVRKCTPISLPMVFALAKAMKKPITDYLL